MNNDRSLKFKQGPLFRNKITSFSAKKFYDQGQGFKIPSLAYESRAGNSTKALRKDTV